MTQPIGAREVDTLPGCLVVTGLPGAGKSTVTRLVAAALPRAARIDGDAVNEMIVSGWVGPVSEPADEARRQLRLRALNICTLANNFAEADFTPVVDHVVPDRAVLRYMVGMLRPRPVLFVVLAPGLAVCRRRNAARTVEERVDYDFGPLDEEMRAELADTGWWLDTAELTAAETVREIMAHAGERAVVAG